MINGVHVVWKNSLWGVRISGRARITKYFPTQREAIQAARQIAKNKKAELFIHRKDGRIRDRRSYGNDPYPPPG